MGRCHHAPTDSPRTRAVRCRMRFIKSTVNARFQATVGLDVLGLDLPADGGQAGRLKDEPQPPGGYLPGIPLVLAPAERLLHLLVVVDADVVAELDPEVWIDVNRVVPSLLSLL